MRSDRERLEDIREAIERILKYTARGKTVFKKDELIQTWVVHHLQIIGEAAARVSEDFKKKTPRIPWREIAAMRNIIVHEYFGIDVEEVWAAAKRDLPALKKQIQTPAK